MWPPHGRVTSVLTRWEQWCRWNCDLRVINARKKGIFCRTESVAMTPKSRDHMPTMSLWGAAAKKWPTQALKTKLILCPRDPQGYSRISLSLSGRILKEYQNIVSASKQTSCGIPWGLLRSSCGIPWGLRNRTLWSARYTNGRDVAQQESQLVWIVQTSSTFASLRVDCVGAHALLYLGSSANCYSSRQHSRPA